MLVIADGATSKLATKMGYCNAPPKVGLASWVFEHVVVFHLQPYTQSRELVEGPVAATYQQSRQACASYNSVPEYLVFLSCAKIDPAPQNRPITLHYTSCAKMHRVCAHVLLWRVPPTTPTLMVCASTPSGHCLGTPPSSATPMTSSTTATT
jgi:hypothetical protein